MIELSPIRLSPFRRVAVLFVADPTCRRFDRIPLPWPCLGLDFDGDLDARRPTCLAGDHIGYSILHLG